jgi:phage terminase Nu1 subunit (DNA packaging protein)
VTATAPLTGWVSPKTASMLLGLTVRQLANLADEKKVVARVGKGGQREYLFPDSRESYLRSKVDTAIAEALAKIGPKTDSPEAAKARLANAQADMVEFELAKKRGEYVSIAFHLSEIESTMSRVNGAISALGPEYRDRSLELTPDTVDAFWETVEDGLRARLHDAVSQHNADDRDPADEPPAEAA